MNVVFFIRVMNDFDHALPIIDFISRIKKENVIVYGVGDKYKSCKQHLDYLNNILGIKERSFEECFYSDTDMRLFNFFNKLSRLKIGKSKLLNIPISILVINLQRIVNLYLTKIVRLFFKGLPKEETCILMDFGTEGTFPYNAIIKKCQSSNIPIVAYLHGFSIFTNLDPIKIEKTKLPYKLNLKMQQVLYGKYLGCHFDRYLVGVGQKSTLFKSNFSQHFMHYDLVDEIGMPRYSKEWSEIFINKYNMQHPSLDAFPNNNNINVVLFLSSAKYSVKLDAFNNMIESLATLACINLIIKPHPRFELAEINDISDKAKVSVCDSPTLIKWADIAILYGSSIGFDVLVNKKQLIIPRFVHTNTTVFEDYNVSKVVDSIDELMDYLKNYPDKDSSNLKDIQLFLKKYVYGENKSYSELLNRYTYYIKD